MHVGERFVRHDRPLRILQVSDFAIQLIAGEATAKNPAEQVLLVQRGTHQGRGNGSRVVQEIHFARFKVSIRLGADPGTDRHDKSGLSSPDGHSIL